MRGELGAVTNDEGAMTARRDGILLTGCWLSFAAAAPLGGAFTYQGQLKEAGQPATGLYDLQFCLFDMPANVIPLGYVADQNDVTVDTGVCTVMLDFGSAAFNGQDRYLEVRVRPGARSGSGSYTSLLPRQSIRPTLERCDRTRRHPRRGPD